jgi:hypothetical protein
MTVHRWVVSKLVQVVNVVICVREVNVLSLSWDTDYPDGVLDALFFSCRLMLQCCLILRHSHFLPDRMHFLIFSVT